MSTILIVNKFFYPRGGSENTIFNIAKNLQLHGHTVGFFSMEHPKNLFCKYKRYFVSYVDFHFVKSPIKKIETFFRVLYSIEARSKIEKIIRELKPDILQCHNIAHQITPSIYHPAKKYNCKIVQFLHDFKVVCPVYTMVSNGKICSGRCKNRKFYWCLLKKCSHNSFFWSLCNTLEMYLHHSILRLYDLVDVFVSPSRFLKNKVKEMGLKVEIVVLPNFVWIDEFLPQYDFKENSICYFGRLSPEKGLFTLLEAVKGLNVKLKLIGEGPLKESLKLKVKSEMLNNIEFLGYKSGEELKNEIKKSMFVVLPSEWYENNPRTVLESFALGKPVLGSRIGGIPELVKDFETGLTFEMGDIEDLRAKIIYLIKNPDKILKFGKSARKYVEENHNPDKYYQELIKIYKMAMARHS